MEPTKEESYQNIDSGLGGSFGPDEVYEEEEASLPSIDNLDIGGASGKDNNKKVGELMEQAFSPDEENDT